MKFSSCAQLVLDHLITKALIMVIMQMLCLEVWPYVMIIVEAHYEYHLSLQNICYYNANHLWRIGLLPNSTYIMSISVSLLTITVGRKTTFLAFLTIKNEWLWSVAMNHEYLTCVRSMWPVPLYCASMECLDLWCWRSLIKIGIVLRSKCRGKQMGCGDAG